MTEKNRDILTRAMNELPKRNAGNSNWNNISGSLDHLEVDQFLSDNLSSLPKHKAPKGAWSKISAEIKYPWYTLHKNTALKIGSLFIIISTLTVSLFLFIPNEKENEKSDINYSKKTSEIPVQSDITSNDGSESGQNKNKEKNAVLTKNDETDLRNNEQINTISQQNLNASRQEISQQTEQKITPSAKIFQKENQNYSVEIASLNSINNSLLFFDNERSPVFKENIFIRTSFDQDYYRERDNTHLALATYYSLINFQNVQVENMEIPESVSSFGIEMMIEKPKLFFKTGLSYLSWEEKARYDFEYRQNEIIYSYHYVDSALVNPSSGNIDYYTTLKNVFDSVSHEKNDEISYRYRVLQIPLMLGYKILDKRNIMITLNGGIGADLSIGGREYVPLLNESQARVTRVVNYLDYRFKVNWRIMGGVGMYYNFSDRLSFYLEPLYHHYMKSIYRNSGLKKVSYIEFKTGLVFKF